MIEEKGSQHEETAQGAAQVEQVQPGGTSSSSPGGLVSVASSALAPVSIVQYPSGAQPSSYGTANTTAQTPAAANILGTATGAQGTLTARMSALAGASQSETMMSGTAPSLDTYRGATKQLWRPGTPQASAVLDYATRRTLTMTALATGAHYESDSDLALASVELSSSLDPSSVSASYDEEAAGGQGADQVETRRTTNAQLKLRSYSARRRFLMQQVGFQDPLIDKDARSIGSSDSSADSEDSEDPL
eukprot:gene26103-11817_t